MNVNALIDAIVRQTTILIAQLATLGSGRAQLAHNANQVFLDPQIASGGAVITDPDELSALRALRLPGGQSQRVDAGGMAQSRDTAEYQLPDAPARRAARSSGGHARAAALLTAAAQGDAGKNGSIVS